MYLANVRPLLSAVAGTVNGADPAITGRVAVDRVPAGWSLADGPYAVVGTVDGPAPVLRGDGGTLTRSALVEVTVTELEATEDPTLVETIAAALIAGTVDGYRLRIRSTVRLPDPDTDAVRHTITLAAPLVR